MPSAGIRGAYLPGEFLPMEPELMIEYDVSRTTIRKAVALLRADGYVDATRGRGTEMLVPARQESSTYPFTSLLGRTTVESRILDPDATRVAQGATIETVPAPPQVAEALRLAPGTPVHRVQCLKIVDDWSAAPIAIYLEAAAFPGLDKHSGTIHYRSCFLAEHYGTRFHRSRSRLSAVAADFVESRLLDVPPNSPLVL